MEGSYGLFPRFLGVSSSIVAVIAICLSLYANLLGGLLVSAIILAAWAGFLRLVTYLFEPECIRQFSNSEPVKKTPVPDLEDVDPDEPADVSSLVRVINTPTAAEMKERDRILRGANKSLVAQARIISQPQSSKEIRQGFESQDALERQEDIEWADMFRAL
jgi:hypothetical protein